MSNPFDGQPFSLTLVDNTVLFTFAGDPTVYGWAGPVARDEDGTQVCRIELRASDGLIDGPAVTADVEAQFAAFFTANALDWPSNQAAIDGMRAQKPVDVSGAPDAPSSSADTAHPSSPTITHEDELSPADPNPEGTHVVVPTTYVAFLHRLANDVEQGFEGAEQAFVRAFRRVFHLTAA
jgi:hypothetical protein